MIQNKTPSSMEKSSLHEQKKYECKYYRCSLVYNKFEVKHSHGVDYEAESSGK
jgi:hypothetical protein